MSVGQERLNAPHFDFCLVGARADCQISGQRIGLFDLPLWLPARRERNKDSQPLPASPLLSLRPPPSPPAFTTSNQLFGWSLLTVPAFGEITSNCLGCNNEVIPSPKGALLWGDVCLQRKANALLGVVCGEPGTGQGSVGLGSCCERSPVCPIRGPARPGEQLLFLALRAAGSSRAAPCQPEGAASVSCQDLKPL